MSDRPENSNAITVEDPLTPNTLRRMRPSQPVDELRLTSEHLFTEKHARALTEWPTVRQISLWCTVTKPALRLLLARPDLRELLVLDLRPHGGLEGMDLPELLDTFSCGWMSGSDLCQIAQLPGLKHLDARNAKLTDAALTALIDNPALTNLDIEASNLNDRQAEIIAKSNRITKLAIGGTHVGASGLKHITRIRQLRALDIWALDISEDDLGMLAALPNLECLSIGGCTGQTSLTAKGVMAKLLPLSPLKRLWIDGIALTGQQTALLKGRHVQVRITCDP